MRIINFLTNYIKNLNLKKNDKLKLKRNKK